MPDKPFASATATLTKEQAVAYATGIANGVTRIGPKHLPILEVDFLKPTCQNDKAWHPTDDWE